MKNTNFDQPFLSFQAKNIFIGKSRVCQMTDFSGTMDNSNFKGVTILLLVKEKKFVYIS